MGVQLPRVSHCINLYPADLTVISAKAKKRKRIVSRASAEPAAAVDAAGFFIDIPVIDISDDDTPSSSLALRGRDLNNFFTPTVGKHRTCKLCEYVRTLSLDRSLMLTAIVGRRKDLKRKRST